MKTKKETSKPAKRRRQESIFSEMKVSDMIAIDRKIHDLLVAEGYFPICTSMFEGMELNNYTNINRMEFQRGDRERVIFYSNYPGQKKTS